ncbi:MAG: glycoside hydrolase family 57 protein [Bacillota bacterium]
MSTGSFVFVLHSHLPYCRKAGVWPFGEEWVFEAMAETYIPLLDIVSDLVARGVPARLTVGLTPVLLDQLQDPYMLFRFDEYVETKIAAAEGDIARFEAESEGRFRDLARFYRDRYDKVRTSFHERYGRDLVSAFRRLQDEGHIELVAGAATHAYLPLLARESSVCAQVKVGCDTYERCFGRKPMGIWLPECGYRPRDSSRSEPGSAFGRAGVDGALGAMGIRHFFVDAHAIQGGTPVGMYGAGLSQRQPPPRYVPSRPGFTTYLPYSLPGSDIAVLGRNERTALQVWSSEWGYPGDGNYREFHKRDSISGFRYWKVTSRLVDLGSKEVYQHEAALARAREHADHFVGLVERLLGDFHRDAGKHGIIVAPFDVELFGHWWMEGLDWLRWAIEGLARSDNVELTTAAGYLESHPPSGRIDLVESSWGMGGGHYIWDNEATGWMWDEVHASEGEMERIAAMAACADDGPVRPPRHEGDSSAWTPDGAPRSFRERILRQAAREALLLQSSDWPFLVTTDQAADYASRRFLEHRHRFTRLLDALQQGDATPEAMRYLEEIEAIDALFPDIDPAAFSVKQGSASRR